jgi:tetratricopeptide (TPR) repeat protein
MIEDLLDFGNRSGSARALALAHFVLGASRSLTGDSDGAIAAWQYARDVAPDPLYRSLVEAALGGSLVERGTAREVIEPAIRFAEERGLLIFLTQQRMNQSMMMIFEGELTRGMNQLEAVRREAAEAQAFGFEKWVDVLEASVYARIATGEGVAQLSLGEKVGAMVRNLGFFIGRGRRASQLARDALAELSDNLPPQYEGLRAGIEFEFAKLLVKRKERDEARKHLEKAIAFLQPLGDSVGMRQARELLATLE